jgi:hypothetical protein
MCMFVCDGMGNVLFYYGMSYSINEQVCGSNRCMCGGNEGLSPSVIMTLLCSLPVSRPLTCLNVPFRLRQLI